MKRVVTIFLALSSFASLSQAGIDFNGGTTERVLDGIKFPQLVFNENGHRITYEQPRGWTVRQETGRIQFTPPGVTQAQAEIDQSPLPAPLTFDDETIKALQAKALASLPPGSQNGKVESEQKTPVMKKDHDTYVVTLSCKLNGQEFMTDVLYFNLADTLVRFRVTARKGDFDKLFPPFRASVISWQWTEPATKAAVASAPKTGS